MAGLAHAQSSAVAAPAPAPLAPQVKGSRPRVNPGLVAPAARSLVPALRTLAAPPSLALPVTPGQVRIQELRPLGLTESLNLAEVNNPSLRAVASQVEQAQSTLRAQIALWYPTINLNATSLPT